MSKNTNVLENFEEKSSSLNEFNTFLALTLSDIFYCKLGAIDYFPRLEIDFKDLLWSNHEHMYLDVFLDTLFDNVGPYNL